MLTLSCVSLPRLSLSRSGTYPEHHQVLFLTFIILNFLGPSWTPCSGYSIRINICENSDMPYEVMAHYHKWYWLVDQTFIDFIDYQTLFALPHSRILSTHHIYYSLA